MIYARRHVPLRLFLIVSVAVIMISPSHSAVWPASQGETATLANQPTTEYRARRERLMERLKDGVIVMVGAREEDFGEVGRFRQKNDFMYLSGVQTPGAFLMLVPAGLTPDKAAREVAFIPARNPGQERWTGVQLGPGAEAAAAFGIKEVAASESFEKRLGEILALPAFKSGQAKIYTVASSRLTPQTTREHLFLESIRRQAPGVSIADVSATIAEMRKVKSPAEIALLQRAVDITAEAQRDVARAIKPGVYEYQVQAALEYAFARNGAERPGFPSIVGSGIYSTILHYNENRKKIEAGDTIVVDIGAEYSYYTADITRTYPATGKFTPRQREIYQLVLDAQRAAEKAFKTGATGMFDLQEAATNVFRSSPLRDKQGRTLERYFIHGLGHWLGMDVHDVGSYSGPMPVGSVFTIEPGIYIPDEKLGVRIEDDYLVTEKGLVKLSEKVPSHPDDIERIMAGQSVAGNGPGARGRR